MVTFQVNSKPVILVQANPNRTKLLIGNLSNTTVYVNKDGMDLVTFTERSWPVKLNGSISICDDCNGYKGPIYVMVSAASDLRVFEA